MNPFCFLCILTSTIRRKVQVVFCFGIPAVGVINRDLPKMSVDQSVIKIEAVTQN